MLALEFTPKRLSKKFIKKMNGSNEKSFQKKERKWKRKQNLNPRSRCHLRMAKEECALAMKEGKELSPPTHTQISAKKANLFP